MRLVTFVALLALTGCGVVGSGPDTCGLSAVEPFKGRDLPEGAFEGRTEPVRILLPGSVMTMDFVPQRLNVRLDSEGRVLRSYCG